MKNNPMMMTMKTIYILTALIGLQITTLFASNHTEGITMNNKHEIIDLQWLAPLAPATADFSDEAPALEMDVTDLVPVIPGVATFEDEIGSGLVSREVLHFLAPKTPLEADFEDIF